MPIGDLSDLERKLSQLSHSGEALKAIQHYALGLRGTRARLEALNSDGAMLRSPIMPFETRSLGFDSPDDDFALLQGDIVRTEAAYYFGERIVGQPKYIVLNSSCDLVPDRRRCAALLHVKEVRKVEQDARSKINLLLQFKKTDSMYLPIMIDDDDSVACNLVDFDGICQISTGNLLLAKRVASLSLVGWRMFASFARTVIARSTPREAMMREALERQPHQAPLEFRGDLPSTQS